MECCCAVLAGTPNCFLEMLDKLQKQKVRSVGPLLSAFLESLACCWNVASCSLFCRYYFVRCSSGLAQLVPLLCSCVNCTCYSDRLDDFPVTIPRCYKDVFVNNFFPRTTKFWNSLPIECFPLTYDLNGFKARSNGHLLSVVSFSTDFIYALMFWHFFFL